MKNFSCDNGLSYTSFLREKLEVFKTDEASCCSSGICDDIGTMNLKRRDVLRTRRNRCSKHLKHQKKLMIREDARRVQGVILIVFVGQDVFKDPFFYFFQRIVQMMVTRFTGLCRCTLPTSLICLPS